jgi:hypothetical protein
MNKKAQVLIPISAIIAMIIILSSFYITTLNIQTINKEEIFLKEVNISYFCIQSLSYGTQRSFNYNINENNTQSIAKIAENLANEYLNNSLTKAEKISKNKNIVKTFITNNNKKGKDGFFSVYCLYDNRILFNVTLSIVATEIFIIAESENVYYKVEITLFSFFKKHFFTNYQIETYYNNIKVDSLILASDNKFTIITEGKYKDSLLIKIINNFGIIFWLLA